MKVQEEKQPQEWLNNLYIGITVWLITIGEENQERNYRAIVRGLLPEVLRQQKQSKTDMEFVLDRWSKSDGEQKTISRLLKSGIVLYNRLWKIFVAVIVILFIFSNCSNNSSNRRRNTYSSRRPAPTFTQPRGRSNNTRNNYVRPTYRSNTRNTPVQPTHRSRVDTVNQITKQEALNLVANWLKAKTLVFGRTYNTDTLSKYTTGKYYSDRQSTIKQLKDKGEYMKYYSPSVQSVGELSVIGKTATIKVNVWEKYTVYNDSGQAIWNESPEGLYSWTLKFENGSWKIAAAEKIN